MSDAKADRNEMAGTDRQGADAQGEDQRDEARTRWLLLGVAFAVLWLFVRGVDIVDDGQVVLWHALGEFIIGLVVGVPIAFLFRRFYSPTPVVVRTPGAVVAAAKYVAVFLWDLITANVDVARRVLSPSMPIEPAVIEVPLRVESDLAITTIANSITLTPGTLTMDYDADHNSLYVHTLAATDPADVVDPIRTWEDYALVMFDERLEPGSPVPEIDVGDDAPAASGDATTPEPEPPQGGDGDE